jgi:spore coat polysaccharide biosynthesis protein SpsF
MSIGHETLLARVVRRLSQASSVDVVVVATTCAEKDVAIVKECRALGVPCIRGPEEDVLDRYHKAAKSAEAEVIIRITADCPLIDPNLVDAVASVFFRENADFACNVLSRTYPRGLDTEMITMESLARLQQLARESRHREHVTLFCYERPALFRIASVTNNRDYSYHRWTVDTPEDLELVRAIYAHFEYRNDFSWQDALDFLERSPELMKLNAHIQQKAAFTTASTLSI